MAFGFGFGLPRGGNTVWSPASLFAQNEPGVWYDPSDMTTLFQDAAGTTPVTAVEQAVGLMLDKSRGLALGSELVTNGNFSNGTTGWIAANSTITASSGACLVTATTLSPVVSQAITTVVGKTYRISANVLQNTSAAKNVFLYAGNEVGAGNYANYIIGTNPKNNATLVFTASATTVYISLAGGSNWVSGDTFTIDNISVRELPGIHATSLTTSRPVLTARVNGLTQSEDFSGWIKTGSATTTKNTLTVTSSASDSIYKTAGSYYGSVPSGVSLTVSIELSGSGSIILAGLSGVGGTQSPTTIVLTNTPTRYSVTYTNNAAGTNIGILVSSAGQAITVTLDKADFRATDQASLGYQRVNTATDYDTVGFPMWLKADGVDDYMVTGTLAAPVNLNLTTTDKVTVATGVRKLSDAAAGVAAELSVSSSSNPGIFAVFSPTGAASADFGWRSAGSVSVLPTAFGYTAPITNVFSGLGDISGDRATLRINGAQVAQSTADQGTGNYGTYPLYQFRRAGISLPFNGLSAGLTVVGRTLTAAELSQLETYYQQKTKAY